MENDMFLLAVELIAVKMHEQLLPVMDVLKLVALNFML